MPGESSKPARAANKVAPAKGSNSKPAQQNGQQKQNGLGRASGGGYTAFAEGNESPQSGGILKSHQNNRRAASKYFTSEDFGTDADEDAARRSMGSTVDRASVAMRASRAGEPSDEVQRFLANPDMFGDEPVSPWVINPDKEWFRNWDLFTTALVRRRLSTLAGMLLPACCHPSPPFSPPHPTPTGRIALRACSFFSHRRLEISSEEGLAVFMAILRDAFTHKMWLHEKIPEQN